MLRDVMGELVRIAGVIGELDHFVALIVVAENDEAASELRFGSRNAGVHFLVGQARRTVQAAAAARRCAPFRTR